MRSNGHQCSLPGKVLVQFVLKSNEGFISSLVEMDIPKDGARNIRADFHRLNLKLSKCQRLHIYGCLCLFLTSSFTIIVSSSPFEGATRRYSGDRVRSRKIFSMRAMPSMQRRSYLEIP